jgi:hypothetical protein
MSRLVLPLERSTRDVPRAYQRPDEYFDRVAKYIPAEVVGGYASLDGIVAAKLGPAGKTAFQLTDTAFAQGVTPPAETGSGLFVSALLSALATWPGIVFVICLVLAPLYVWALARRAGNTVWKAQALIAVLAFAVWAYAIKGNVFFSPTSPLNAWTMAQFKQPFYDPVIGAMLLVLFSMVVAFYQPKTG